jgi:hypothetical protein
MRQESEFSAATPGATIKIPHRESPGPAILRATVRGSWGQQVKVMVESISKAQRQLDGVLRSELQNCVSIRRLLYTSLVEDAKM